MLILILHMGKMELLDSRVFAFAVFIILKDTAKDIVPLLQGYSNLCPPIVYENVSFSMFSATVFCMIKSKNLQTF